MANYSWARGLPSSVVDTPSDFLLGKTYFAFPSRWSITNTFPDQVEFGVYFSLSVLGFGRPGTLWPQSPWVHMTICPVSFRRHWFLAPPPLSSTVFLPPLPHRCSDPWTLKVGVWWCHLMGDESFSLSSSLLIAQFLANTKQITNSI